MTKVSNPLISVIVPVYNVEKYLDKCIDSIVNQTYTNLEIILIEDGSPDNCPKICDDWAKKDSRIKVIHKENGGLSKARNVGLDMAKGEYITFVDSDDTIVSDFIECLYNLNIENNTKISVTPYTIVTDNKKVSCSNEKGNLIFTQKEALERMLLDRGFTVSVCSKLFASSLFNDIRFPEGKVFEDTATTYKLFLKCDYISYNGFGGYYYYKRENSVINSKYNEKQLLFIKNTDEMGDDILKVYPDLYEAVESKKIDSRFSLYRRMIMIKNLNATDKKIKNEIKNYILLRRKKILFGHYNKKIKLATILLSMGDRIFRLSWKIYSKFKYEI